MLKLDINNEKKWIWWSWVRYKEKVRLFWGQVGSLRVNGERNTNIDKDEEDCKDSEPKTEKKIVYVLWASQVKTSDEYHWRVRIKNPQIDSTLLNEDQEVGKTEQ